VRDLAARVDSGIGPARDGQSWRRGQRQRTPECLLDRLLHGGQAGLSRPAVERRAVVGQIDAEPKLREPGRR